MPSWDAADERDEASRHSRRQGEQAASSPVRPAEPSPQHRRPRPSRPEVARAAVASGLLLLTTLLLAKGSSAARLPAEADPQLHASWRSFWRQKPQPQDALHPECYGGRRQRPADMQPVQRGECWDALIRGHNQQNLPWWAPLRRPWQWLRYREPRPMPQDVAAAAAEIAGDDQWADGDAPMTQFNDSSMAPIFSHDVAWMMEQEEERAHGGNRTHDQLSVELAMSLAHINSIAYCETPNVAAWNCTRCNGAAAGFQLYSLINDVGWDLRAFVGYAPVLGAKVVAFRGTDSHSWYNWAQNMRAWRVDLQLPYPGAQGALVHSGFFYSYNLSSLQPNISAAGAALEKQYPGDPWYVIGHSMGAAMATICALDLRFSIQPTPDVRIYTFGSPRVGNDIFATFFQSVFQESYRFTHNRDIVPSVPLQIMGFHHISREVWVLTFDAGPTIIGMCDRSGEDPACHNSVCYLGLCTSIHDHMTYLGGHMYHRNPIGC